MARSKSLEALLLVLPILALPALLFGLSRGDEPFRYPEPPERWTELVLASPQWEGIKVEFEEGFQRWLWERERIGVRFQWLDHGGGTKTLRWIEEQFDVKPHSIGVDLLFGGGTDPYETLKQKGLLVRYDPPAAVLAGVPETIGGFPILDCDRMWFGTALTGFGIVFNAKVFETVPVLRALAGVRFTRWEDLARDELDGWVGGADPRGSSSYHTFYEILLQQPGPGRFERGMELARRLSANVRSYTKFSAEIPKLCTVGQIACAPTIDQYALAQIEKVGPAMGFSLPDGQTLVNADAAGILKGAPNRETAEQFIDFLLSPEAGRLWLLRRGEAGGPRRFQLNRASVRPDLYAETAGRSEVTVNPFLQHQLEGYDFALASRRWTVLNDFLGAVLIDTGADLARAMRACRSLAGEPRAAAERMLFQNPVDEDGLNACAARWTEATFRETTKNEWTAFARAQYAAVARLGSAAHR